IQEIQPPLEVQPERSLEIVDLSGLRLARPHPAVAHGDAHLQDHLPVVQQGHSEMKGGTGTEWDILDPREGQDEVRQLRQGALSEQWRSDEMRGRAPGEAIFAGHDSGVTSSD